MAKHTVKEWLFATRPWSFPASLAPVLATLCFLFYKGADVNWVLGIWAIVNIILFHAAGNTWSDYHDYTHGVDRDDTFGVKTITSGQFSADDIKRLSLALLTVAVVGGLVLTVLTGWQLLIIGALGFAFTVFYPQLKFNALGDFDILCTYAIIPSLGTSFVATGVFDPSVLLVALPLGSVTVAILHANNTRDIAHDGRAGITTLAMHIGLTRSVWLYNFEIALPFIWIPALCAVGFLPWLSLLIILGMMPAMANMREATAYSNGVGDIALLDANTAKLQLILTLLLSATMVTAHLI